MMLRVSKFLVLLLILGCKQKPFNDRLVDFVNNEKNHLVQKIKIGNVEMTTKWQPYTYRKIFDNSQLAGTDSAAQSEFYYFNVRFDKHNDSKPEKNKIIYLDFDMQNDFSLVVNGDSVPAAICQKIENGKGGSYEYMVVFPKTNIKSADFTLVYTDKIFSIGTIDFVFRKEDVQKIPTI